MRRGFITRGWIAALALSAVLVKADDAGAADIAISASSSAPHVLETKLANGLTVVIDRDPNAPVISLDLRYGTGSRDDPPEHAGMAILLQRMMVSASMHVPESSYYQTMERIGASPFSQGTASDYTELWATVPANAMSTVLWLWSDQMGFFVPRVDQAMLDKQRDIVKSERRQTVENAPYGTVHELARQALYPEGHPYHGITLGDSLDGVTVRDVKTQFDAHYAPNNAVLVIAGNVSADAVIADVQKYFGAIPSGALPPIIPVAPQKPQEVRQDVVASVQEAAVVMTWPTPPEFAPGDADLEAVARILAGKRVALLHWSLIDQMKIATAITAQRNPRALGSDFEIWVNVAAGHTPDEVITAIDNVLTTYKSGGLLGSRFDHAFEEAWLPKLFALEKPAARANRYATYVFAFHDASSIDADFKRYDAVNADSARKAATQWLVPQTRVVTVVTPDPNAPPSGQLRGSNVVSEDPVPKPRHK